MPNQRLDLRGLSPWDEVDLGAGIRVPVVTLEPEAFLAWAKVVSSKQGAWCPGFIFEPDVTAGASQFEGLDSGESAEQRVQRFRATASPMARRLAGLLAAAPVISLPIVRIIRDRLLPESRQVHVAEFFGSQLLEPLLRGQSSINPDLIKYNFISGVREFLIESVSTEDALDVLEEVSKFVSGKFGISMKTFTAILKDPSQAAKPDFLEQSYSFAYLTTKILKQLGGKYKKFANKLENDHIIFNSRSLDISTRPINNLPQERESSDTSNTIKDLLYEKNRLGSLIRMDSENIGFKLERIEVFTWLADIKKYQLAKPKTAERYFKAALKDWSEIITDENLLLASPQKIVMIYVRLRDYLYKYTNSRDKEYRFREILHSIERINSNSNKSPEIHLIFADTLLRLGVLELELDPLESFIKVSKAIDVFAQTSMIEDTSNYRESYTWMCEAYNARLSLNIETRKHQRCYEGFRND